LDAPTEAPHPAPPLPEAPRAGDIPHVVEDRDPLLGRVVDGRYRVLQKLGEGGMGAVYQVEHVHMGKYMAMKLLLREFSGNRDLVRRFRREAQAISRLTHPHTVQVFDFGRSADGAMYMVMEYLQGETLADIIARDGPLTPRRAARIVSQICQSLAEAHGLGIIHRDLKPENVMMVRSRDERDYVKVLDFGLAKLRDRPERDAGATSHGSLIGTPYYMSPEQIRGGDVDARCDLYALGAMTYKMLTGEPPFRAPSPIAVLTRHLNDPPPPVGGARPELGGTPLEAVLLRAMAKDPDKRFDSVDSFRRALDEATEALSSVPTPSTSMRASRHSVPLPSGPLEDAWAADRAEFEAFERRMRRRRYLGLLVFLVLVGGGAGTVTWGYFEGGWFERRTESEPNNQRSQANALELGKPLRGHIGKRLSETMGDVDWYRVKPDKGAPPSVLRIEVTPVRNIDFVVEAYEKEHRQVAALANEKGVGGGEVIPNLRFDGSVYIKLSEAPGVVAVPTENSSDAYTISATARPLRANEEREPNDDLFGAQEMPVGAAISGYHGRKGDRDYFRFPRTGVKDEAFEVKFKAVSGIEVNLEVITANLRLPNKVPGRVALPAGDNSFYVMVESPRGSSAHRAYTLQVDRAK
jgi:serine/threonine-protein kinase